MSRLFPPGLLILLLMFVGCGQDVPASDPTARETPTVAPTEQVTDATPGTSETMEANQATGTVIEVQLAEYQVLMPPGLLAGRNIFEITNRGQMEHNFVLEGGDTSRTFELPLQPGESRTLPLELAAGSYQVYCPLNDHADLGMKLVLTVSD